MKKEQVLIGVHTSKPADEEAQALVNAFVANGMKAMIYEDCMKQNLTPNMTIGFDSAGLPHWQKILNNGALNILWSKDSVFSNNLNFIEQFASFSNFVLFTPTPTDTEPVGQFFPKMRHGYLPLANYKNYEIEPQKIYDIVICANIIDVEKKMDELEAQMPEFVYKLMHDILTVSLQHPELSFWQLYKLFQENLGLTLDYEQYVLLFSNLAHLITSHKYIEILDKLKDLNVRVFGNEVWKKYISGNTKYMGLQHPDTVSKAKMLVHAHPVELSLGLPENVLDAAAAHTFVLSSNTKSLELEFKNTFGYYNYAQLDDVRSKAERYINNDEERKTKTAKAFDILRQRHTLKNRVAEIIKIMQ